VYEVFAALRQLRSIQRSVSNDVLQSLVVVLVFSRLDRLWPRDSYRPSETALGQASVCAERCCTIDFHSSSSRPRPASTSQPTLASSPRKYFFPAGGASVSLSSRLCTWLPDVRSAARLRPQHTSATALFQYVNGQRLSLQGPCVLLSATVPSRRLLHLFGTVCRSQFELRHHCQSSAVGLD